jgi:hypothetical protein
MTAAGVVVLATLAVACESASGDAASFYPVADAGSGGIAAGVTFDHAGTLTALPSQSIDVALTVRGADADVQVWLEGDYADGSLAADHVESSGGHASVTLRTPSSTTTFTMGARAPTGGDARLAVSVSATGFTTLRVLPAYETRRAHTTFQASAFVHATCTELAGAAIHDASLAAGGIVGQAIEIASVPSGGHVAVTTRAGHFGFGCVDLDGLATGGTTTVPITLYDVPMALEQTNLEATFTFEPDATGADAKAWQAILTAGASRVEQAFFASGTEDKALVDAMRETVLSVADRALFDAARTQYGWDAKVATWLYARRPTLHDRAAAWLDGATAAPFGSLVAHLAPEKATGTALVQLEAFDASDARSAGFADPAAFDWSADAQDKVHLAGTVDFAAASLAATRADARARGASVPAPADVASVLADAIDCTGIGDALAAAGVAYGTCNATCMADACRGGLEARWSSAARGPTATADRTQVKLTASADAQVGEYAEPLRFTGTWLGAVTATSSRSAMKGAATAEVHDLH